MCRSPVGRIRVGTSKSEEMKELLSWVADLPVHFAKETWLEPFSPLTNGDSSVNQDILLVDFLLPVVLLYRSGKGWLQWTIMIQ